MELSRELEELIWCAGFFDGEGCITIGKVVRKDRGFISFMFHVTACQIRIEPLQVLQRVLGGSILETTTDDRNYKLKLKRRRIWRWGIYNPKDGIEALKKLKPYLVRKADEVDFVLRYPPPPTEKRGTIKRSIENEQQWEFLYRGLSALKWRDYGVAGYKHKN